MDNDTISFLDQVDRKAKDLIDSVDGNLKLDKLAPGARVLFCDQVRMAYADLVDNCHKAKAKEAA